jgi:hypothetical protein
MKKLLMIFATLALAVRANAQATNPQNTFSNAVNVNNPSLWLNFNDFSTSFKDQISQSNFGPTGAASLGTMPTTLLAGGTQSVTVNPNPTPSGTMNSFCLAFSVAPTSGQTETIALFSGTIPSLTIISSFVVTVAATAGIQCFTAPTNFTAVTTTAGEHIGYWTASGTAPSEGTPAGAGVYYLNGQTTLPVGAHTYSFYNALATGIVPVITQASAGTTTVQQPGFDSTNNANYSAEFTYNALNAAPNNTLGDIEWDVPWTMLIHVDRLNWDRTGTLTLASKGDIQGCTTSGSCVSTGSWWRVFLQVPSSDSLGSQLCFERNGMGNYQAQQTVCTSNYDGMPNGLNYDIVIEDAGTGAPGSLSIYLNGSSVLQSATDNTYGNAFGNVLLTVSGGTGYANSTAFTSTGGGANCVVQGVMTSVNGVPTSIAAGNAGQLNKGCTSNPTIVLTLPTGTGAVITATAAAVSMNSTTSPFMVPGYVSNGTIYGVGGTDTSQNPVYVDEFAIFPGNLSFGQVTNLFYTTKFYQGLLYPGLAANPPLVIFGSYGCGPDFSGAQTLAMTIGAAKAGLIKLLGFVDDDGEPNGSNSVGWYRQMLDNAGFNNVPVSVGPGSIDTNIGGCPAANLTAYNASTPQNASAYESSVTMYRTLFAEYPTKPIYVLATQTANGYAAFVTSPADSISPLTGLQLQAQNAANGGYVNMFQGNLGLTPTAFQTLLADNGSLPIYMFGGTPAPGGPGVLASRTSNDPLYLVASEMSGGDAVSGWTNQNLAQVITPYFYGGVTVTYNGGTGYANSTPFTSTGGGAYCHVTGIMTASGGVPNGIETSWGMSFPSTSTYNGLGYGCTSAPTLVLTNPTGTGVTLTATTTLTVTCYGPSGCTNQYVVSPNQYAQPPGGVWTAPVFTWFQNSLIDPPVNGPPRTY